MAINMTPDLIAALVQDDPSLKRLVSDKAVNAARQQILSQLNLNNTAMNTAPTNEQLVNWGAMAQPAQQQVQQPVAAVPQQAAQPNNPLAIVDTIYKEVIGNFEALHKKLGALAEGVENDFKEVKEVIAKLNLPPATTTTVSSYGTPATPSNNQANSKNKGKED